jgi:hypothetical protein
MQNQKITKRLSRDTSYQRPKKTYQDKLTPDEIEEKLEEYVKIEDINKVPLNSHIRYFTLNDKTGKKEFRLGGFLTNRDQSDKYVILSNGTISWSVQTLNSIFFKKMTIKELKQEYEEKIEQLETENNKLKKALLKYKKKTSK